MEKLIKLLNEYDEWWNWRKLYWKGLWCEDHDTIWYKDKELTCEQDEIISYLISKPYWFIKWLVERNKIEFDNREIKAKFMEELERYPTFNNNTYDRDFNVNGLLMLLAISDTPIDDLISYLK